MSRIRRRSSVVERFLGKKEAGSSILPVGSIFFCYTSGMPDRIREARLVSGDDPEVQERREELHEHDMDIRSRVFGAEELGQISLWRDRKSPVLKSLEKESIMIVRGKLRKFFMVESIVRGRVPPEMEVFAEEVFGSDTLRAHFEEHISSFASLSHEEQRVALAEVLGMCDEERVPDDILIVMLERHVERFGEREKEFEKVEPLLRKNFLSRLQTAVDEGKIPFSYDVVAERFNGATAFLHDYLQFPRDMGRSGSIHRTISLRSSLMDTDRGDPERMRLLAEETFFHEGIEAIRGVAYMRWEHKFEDNEAGEVEYEPRFTEGRSGLTFSGIGGDRKEVFEWLHEAVVEQLALILLDREPIDDARGAERAALQKLLRDGLPWNDLCSAFIEDYDPSLPAGERSPAWKKFRKSVDEHLDGGWKHLLETGKQFRFG